MRRYSCRYPGRARVSLAFPAVLLSTIHMSILGSSAIAAQTIPDPKKPAQQPVPTPQAPAKTVDDSRMPAISPSFQITRHSVIVDRRARALLDQMVSTCKGLTSYSGVIDLQESGLRSPLHLQAEIAMQKPGSCRIRTKAVLDSAQPAKQPGGSEIIASDSGLIVARGTAQGEHYQRLPVSSGSQAIWMALSQSSLHRVTVLGQMLLGRDPLVSLWPRVRQLTLGTPTLIDGVPVDVVEGTLHPWGAADNNRADDDHVTLYIGHKDHLLRRLVRTAHRDSSIVTVTESHGQIQANTALPSSLFAFTPAPGAHEVPAQQPRPANIEGEADVKKPVAERTQAITAPPSPSSPATVPSAPPVIMTQDSGLRVVDAPGLERIGPGDGNVRFTFGTVSLLDRLHVDRVFTLRNVSQSPVTIRRVNVSCPCLSTRVMTPTSSAAALPLELGPGKEMEVQVSVDLTHVPIGPILGKSVLIWAEGKNVPAARLGIQGELAPAVRFAQERLDLGAVRAGERHSTRLTAYFDPRLVKYTQPISSAAATSASSSAMGSTDVPPLVSSSQWVDVHAVTATPVATSLSSVPSNWIARQYEVSVAPDAPLGALDGALLIAANAAGYRANIAPAASTAPVSDPNVGSDIQRIMEALHHVQLPLTGKVVGEIGAEPSSLNFGTLTAGQGVVKTLTLTADTASQLEGVRWASGSPWLSVGLWSPTDAAGDSGHTHAKLHRRLEISLSSDAPIGNLDTELLVTLKSGRRLLIPVSARVLPASQTSQAARALP